ncbi:MAG: protein-disulfide reductase DsbD family protein [Chthoniobacterales bacterium]
MKSGRLLACCGVLLLAMFIAAPAGAQVYEGKQIVKATLLADTTAVVPGKPFTVGLLLRIAPGWHTYWKFSGDAGLPTEIKWKLPQAWKIGEIEWPIPLKLKDPGDIVTYGYNDEVLLMQQITPPASVADTTVKFSAAASWLVCERICIPGSANLELELPEASSAGIAPAAKSTSAAPANTELFARYRKLLPGRAGEIENWNRTPSQISFRFRQAGLANYSLVDLYPLADENTLVGHPSLASRVGDEVTFKVPFENGPPARLRGLIVARQNATDENRTGWYFEGGDVGAFVPTAQKPAAATTQAFGTNASTTHGLATYLLFGFLGGFILNLMPCVLPVISLKIFGFVKQAGQHRRYILRSGILFVAGIFAWFIGLGLLLIVLKAAGHQISWALQFTNPFFVLFLAALVTVFALNLLGVFEISPPETAMRLIGSVAREGDAGSFFHGVFATVLATPCTAPFLGTALGFAFAQSPLIILSMFVAIAAGMSVPYLLLSAQPAWLRFLPKPGPWMERVKELMGFLLLATLLFLLYVLGAQRGYEALIWAACFLLALGLACWMKGAFVLPTASAAQRTIVTALMVLLVVASGIYFIGGKFRSSAIVAAPSGIQQRLDTELAQGHPVFVDFTAAWCITCKFNEKAVLDSADVREAFQRHGVTKLVADWTNGDPEITKLLQHFGRPGVPLYVLYPARSAEPIVFPELITKSIILEKLETIATHVASQ